MRYVLLIYSCLIFIISCGENSKPREFAAVTEDYIANEKKNKKIQTNQKNEIYRDTEDEKIPTHTSSPETSEDILSCPLGFIKVNGNKILNTSDFCVMKYEAKNRNGVAISIPNERPWVYISAENAQIKCRSIKIEGYSGKFALISNPEWMTIARDLESVNENWSGGSVGSGHISRGHTDNYPSRSLAIEDTNDPYSGTENNKNQSAGYGWEQKRTHTLSNKNVIWDFAGNISEWVDWNPSDSDFTIGPTNALKPGGICWIYKYRFPSLSGSLVANDLLPAHRNHDDTKSFGILYPGYQGATTRGGAWPYGSYAGPFSMRLDSFKNYAFVDAGFRCVYRP